MEYLSNYIILAKDTYDITITSGRTIGSYNEFSSNISSKSLSFSFFFTLALDELSNHIQDESLCCMIFTDIILLSDESVIRINLKLEV